MRLHALCAVLLLAAASLTAQVRPPDVPQTVHTWLGLDLGMAMFDAPSMASAKATLGLRAEVGSSIGEHSVLIVDGTLLFPPDGQREVDCGLQSSSNGGPSCASPRPNGRMNGVSVSLGRTWGSVGNTPRFIASAGAGAYRLDGVANETLGVDAAVKWTIADRSHLGLIASAQAIVLPNASHQRVWVVPITIGLRRH